MLACYRTAIVGMEHNPARGASVNGRQASVAVRHMSNGFLGPPDPCYMDSCSISSNDTESRTVDSGVSLSTQNSQQRTMYNPYSNLGPSSPSQVSRSEPWSQHQQHQQHPQHHQHQQSQQQHHQHLHQQQSQVATYHPHLQQQQQQQFGGHTPVRYNHPMVYVPTFSSHSSSSSHAHSGPPGLPSTAQRLCHNPLYAEQHIMESIAIGAAAAANGAADQGGVYGPNLPHSATTSSNIKSASSQKHSRVPNGAAPPPPPPYSAFHNVLYVNAPPAANSGSSAPTPGSSGSSSSTAAPRQSVETQTDAVPALQQPQVPTNLAATISALRLFRVGSGSGSLERGVGPNGDSRRSTLTRGEPELELAPPTAKEVTDSVLMGLSSLSQKLKRSLTLNSSSGHTCAVGNSDVMSSETLPVPRPLPRMCAGVCKVCRQKIISVEDACSAMGNIYHNACFTCCCCGKTLRGKIFYNDHGKIYCEEDYMYCGFQHTAEKCEACGHIITDMILNALGKSFHPGCFRCSVCKKCLDGVPFTVDMANKVYCIQDYHRVYAPKCASCALPIVPIEGSDEVVRVVAMDKDFHIDCYKCEDCKIQLTDEQDRRCYPMTASDGSLHLLCHGCHLNRYTRLPSVVRSPLPGRASLPATTSGPSGGPKHLPELGPQGGGPGPYLHHPHHPQHHPQPTSHRP